MMAKPPKPAPDAAHESDPWHWLREQENPLVLQHLQAENAYTQSLLGAPADLAMKQMFVEEIKARIQEDDVSVPMRDGAYWYFSEMRQGQQYQLFRRKKDPNAADSELLLDANALAQGKKFCHVGFCEHSPDHRYIAYGVDEKGDESYTICVRDLEKGSLLRHKIRGAADDLVWCNDSKSFYYLVLNDNNRPYRVYAHHLGTSAKSDFLVWEEKNPAYFLGLGKSEDDSLIFIHSEGHNSSEIHFLPADKTYHGIAPTLIEARQAEHEYSVDCDGTHLYICTNLGAPNNRLVKTPLAQPGLSHWQTLVPEDSERLMEGFLLFRHYLVMQERVHGLSEIRVLNLADGTIHAIEWGSEPAEIEVVGSHSFEDEEVLLQYTSLKTPTTVYSYNMRTHVKTLVKKEQVPDPKFSEDHYVCERVWASARDGVQVPISLLYRKDTVLDGTAPLYLYAYGAYGINIEDRFSVSTLSVVDRGFVYAVAHVRGGMNLGRQWYFDGKLLKKENTFQDFLDCAEFLISKKYTQAGNIVASGGSAGGMVVGVAINRRPDLFKAAIGQVPFVDVLNTMLDPSLSLTVGEYNEWGNPEDKTFFDYIKSYCPYQNVSSQAYPHVFATAGFSDSRVTYWEPTKWVLKLRQANKGQSQILLRVNFDAGHTGASGRYDYIDEVAESLVFIFKVYEDRL